MIFISIIIPVYNKGQYLERSIESILYQSFNNWELILVDDGSTDGSGLICDKYAAQDSRIKVIHKKNGGVSSARNIGIQNANGTYLVFCDADDTITTNALQILYDAMNNNNADLVVGGFRNIELNTSRNTKIIKEQLARQEISIDKTNIKEKISFFWQENNMMSACGKIFRNDIIYENNITFSEDLVVLEDFCFVLDYLQYSESFICINDVVYNYYSDGGVVGYLHRSRADYVDDVILADKNLHEFINKNDLVCEDELWRSFAYNYQAAYESLWTLKVSGITDRIRKYRRIGRVLKLEPYKRLNKNNKRRYSKIRYYALIHGNVCAILLCNFMGFR